MLAVEKLDHALYETSGPGGWTPKDNLAHLYEWERYLLERIFRNEPLESAMQIDHEAIQDLDEDGINQLFYLRNKERFPGDVLEMLQLTHETVIQELKQVDFEWLLQRRDPSNPEQLPRIAAVAGNTYEHFDEHRANIEAAINQARGE